jgi:hypothetical protein
MTNQKTHDQEPTAEIIAKDIALRELTDDPNLYIFGHGTPIIEHAQGTLRDGLRLRKPDLWSTVLGMKSTVEDPTAAQENATLLEQWPHKNHRFVAMLGIQRLRGEDIPHRRYLQSVVQPRTDISEGDREFGEPYVIEDRFVAGYFDMDAGTFTRNPSFDPHYDTHLLETTADFDITLERNRPPVTAHLIGRPAVTATIEAPVPAHTTAHIEGSDVW